MTLKTIVCGEAGCNERTMREALAVLAVAPLLLAAAPTLAADTGGMPSAGKSSVVTLEKMPGTDAKRVVLSAKAAERLGIQTAPVGEQAIVRRQMVSGLVIQPLEKAAMAKPASVGLGTFGGYGQPAGAQPAQPAGAPAKTLAAGDAWVLVTLSQGEWERLAKDKPARVLPLSLREQSGKEITAMPSGMPPDEDVKRSMLRLYYTVPSKDHGLSLNERTRVELELAGSDAKQKVVPYSAVYYDSKGVAWVYVNPKPLTFERRRIVVERVEGDVAALSDGPPVGTQVVSVGAALLYGTEIFGK